LSSSVDTVIDFENGVDVDIIRKRFADGVQTGEKSRFLVWAGSGVGLMKNTIPAQVCPHEINSRSYISSQCRKSSNNFVKNVYYVYDRLSPWFSS